MNQSKVKKEIISGKTILGIELGSTRIKAVLIGEDHAPIASGSFTWENQYENNIWTYRLEDVWTGIQASYHMLAMAVLNEYDTPLTTLGAIGFSGMMHGYLVFDQADVQLAPFRTWRNTMSASAATRLTELFRFNIPQRWSIAHLYQSILNEEEHVSKIGFLTTLAGYVHWQLTGEKVLGVGEASGVFPIDSITHDYQAHMVRQFDGLVADRNFSWKLGEILPQVLKAGDSAGVLTVSGARLLDVSGRLKPGIPFCPPEGDAGTGMVATNTIAPRTGNISAGTSIFAMTVLEKELSHVYPEIDLVTTPAGAPVAMVHCNNCTSDLDAWVNVFHELSTSLGIIVDKPTLYDTLYAKALEGDADCGGLLSYNYFSGEPITGFEEGRPLFVRQSNSQFTLSNFMRMQLFSTMATLKIGMDTLFEKENVKLDQLLGHGGLFKTKAAGQKLMAAVLGVPVSVMDTASEGGAWGIALLAAFVVRKKQGETLEDYLAQRVFAGKTGECIMPDPTDQRGFAEFIKRYVDGLVIEQAAVNAIK